MKASWVFNLLGVVVVCFCLPGCWDYQRINDRGQIFGIGIDPAEQPDLLHFTFQMPSFEDKRSSTEGATESRSMSAFKNLSVNAHTLAEALALAQTKSEKQLFLGNLEAVILSKPLKSNQVRMVLGELMRNARVNAQALVVTTDDAKKLLEMRDGLAPSDKLDQILGPQMHPYALTTRVRLWDFWRDTVSAGLDPMDTWVNLTPDGLEVRGGYVYHNFHGVIQVSPEQMWALNAARGRLHRTSYSWKIQNGSYVAVQDLETRSRMTVEQQTGQIHVRLRIHLKAILAQDDDQGFRTLTTRDVRQYESDLANCVRGQVVDAVRSIDDQQVDVLGYGRLWLVTHPGQRQEVANHWDEWIKQAKVDVLVRATISQKGGLV